MSPRHLDADWTGWLGENIARGCNPEELLGILLDNDFTLDSIRHGMGQDFPSASPRLANITETVNGPDYKALSKVLATPTGDARLRHPSELAQLYTIDAFIGAQECDALAALVAQNLRLSTVTVEAPGDPYFRTSSTCDLGIIQCPAVQALDEKISRMMRISRSYAETIQGQHYAVGQEFKPHTDYFEPGTDEYARHAAHSGNRTWTFMIYLNDVAGGGETVFPKLGHTVQPRKGRAVVWNNLHADGAPNPNTLHAAMPVTAGEKIVVTKWFRERGGGPMFRMDDGTA